MKFKSIFLIIFVILITFTASATEYFGELSTDISQEEDNNDYSYQGFNDGSSSSGRRSSWWSNSYNTNSTNTNTTNPVITPVNIPFRDSTAFGTNQNIIPEKPVEEEIKGFLEVDLKEKQIISFKVNEEVHSLQIETISQKQAKFIIRSEPIIDILKISEVKTYDLNKDGIKDIRVYLKDIENGVASFKIRDLTEDIENKVTGALVGTKKTDEKIIWMYAILLTGVIIFIAGLTFYFRKRN